MFKKLDNKEINIYEDERGMVCWLTVISWQLSVES